MFIDLINIRQKHQLLSIIVRVDILEPEHRRPCDTVYCQCLRYIAHQRDLRKKPQEAKFQYLSTGQITEMQYTIILYLVKTSFRSKEGEII